MSMSISSTEAMRSISLLFARRDCSSTEALRSLFLLLARRDCSPTKTMRSLFLQLARSDCSSTEAMRSVSPLPLRRDCLPVLGALLVCTVHAVAGQWLARAGHATVGAFAANTAIINAARTHETTAPHGQAANLTVGLADLQHQHQVQQQQQQEQERARPVVLWSAAAASAAFASAFGGLTVATAAASCAMWVTSPGLLGWAPLLLGLALVLRPPRWVRKRNGGGGGGFVRWLASHVNTCAVEGGRPAVLLPLLLGLPLRAGFGACLLGYVLTRALPQPDLVGQAM